MCIHGSLADTPVWSVRNIISQHYVRRHRSAETQHKMEKSYDTFKEVAVMQGWKCLLNGNDQYCQSFGFFKNPFPLFQGSISVAAPTCSGSFHFKRERPRDAADVTYSLDASMHSHLRHSPILKPQVSKGDQQFYNISS